MGVRNGASVNVEGILTANKGVRNVTQELCDEQLGLLYFLERRTERLTEAYEVLE